MSGEAHFPGEVHREAEDGRLLPDGLGDKGGVFEAGSRDGVQQRVPAVLP